jgi:hypothetical protein
MRKRSPLVLAAVLVSAFNVSPLLAQPEVHSIHTPFAVTLVNTCNGEPVAITGTLTTMVQVTVSESGNFHNSIHTVSKGSGSSLAPLSDTKYTYSEEFYSGLNVSGTTTTTQILNHRLNAAGSTDNFFMNVRYHLTVTPNGAPTAMVDRFESGCRG